MEMRWIEITMHTYNRIQRALRDANQLQVMTKYSDTKGDNPLSHGVPTVLVEVGAVGGTLPLLRRRDAMQDDQWITTCFIRG